MYANKTPVQYGLRYKLFDGFVKLIMSYFHNRMTYMNDDNIQLISIF